MVQPEAAGPFCSKGTVLAPCPHRDTKVRLCRAAPSRSAPLPGYPSRTASASPLPEPHEPGPLLSPLSSLRTAAQVCPHSSPPRVTQCAPAALHSIRSEDTLLFAKVSAQHSERKEAFEDASPSQLQLCTGGDQKSIKDSRAETRQDLLVNLLKTTETHTPDTLTTCLEQFFLQFPPPTRCCV